MARFALREERGSLARYLIGAPDGCGEPLAGGLEDVAVDGALCGEAGGLASIGAGLLATARTGDLTGGAAAGFGDAVGVDRGAAFDDALATGDFIGAGADAGADLAIDLAAALSAGLTASRHNAMPPSSPSSLLMIFTSAGNLKVTNRLLPPPI